MYPDLQKRMHLALSLEFLLMHGAIIVGRCWQRWLLAVQGRDVRKVLRCAVHFQPLYFLWPISVQFSKVLQLLLLRIENGRLWLLRGKVLASLRDPQALETRD